jgi:putative copper resistance protein D
VIEDSILIAARAAHYFALSVLVGVPLFQRCVGTRTSGGLGAMALLALVSALVWFLAVAAGMGWGWADVLDPRHVLAVATDTDFGRVWLVRLAVLALLVGLSLPAAAAGRHQGLVLGGAALAAASLALSGHAASGNGTGDAALRMIHGLADAAHALCATAWVGGLVALTFHARDAEMRAALAAALPRFSRLGYVLVAGVVFSGVVNSLMLVATVRDLLATSYGRLLLAKLALVAAMVGLAVLNRFVLTPRIARAEEGATRLFRWSVALETGLGAAVMAAVAVLGTWHPGH